MSAGARDVGLTHCVDAVLGHFEPVLADLGVLADRVTTWLAGSDPAADGLVDDVVHPAALAMLDRHPILGAGLVLAPDRSPPVDLHLAWWEGGDSEPLAAIVTAFSGTPVDGTRQEWYQVPARAGRRHVTAPYVGYLHTGALVVTASAPVRTAAGDLIGVVAADTRVETLETLLGTPLQRAEAVVVHDDGRCLVAADPALVSGRPVDPGAFTTSLPCGDLPLRVLA